MFIVVNANCLLSSKLFTSSTNDYIVVKDPQKPITKKKEYFGSRFHVMDKTENIPRMKLPMIFTIKTFNGSPPNTTSGDSTILYLKDVPQIAPIPRRRNSKLFITNLSLIGYEYNLI
jgi:hypothetical protein